MTPSSAFVAFGANIGDAIQAFDNACKALNTLPETSVLARSSLYRSEAVGVSNHPDYINAVIHLSTTLSPYDLLDRLLSIEAGYGRIRGSTVLPRTMDLDLLLQDDLVINSPKLTLPHPRMHLRAFVLQPLAEIVPDLSIPLHGELASLLHKLANQRIERLPNTSQIGS